VDLLSWDRSGKTTCGWSCACMPTWSMGGGWPICGRPIGEGGTKVVGSSKGFQSNLVCYFVSCHYHCNGPWLYNIFTIGIFLKKLMVKIISQIESSISCILAQFKTKKLPLCNTYETKIWILLYIFTKNPTIHLKWIFWICGYIWFVIHSLIWKIFRHC
jgi:hypothetical protein